MAQVFSATTSMRTKEGQEETSTKRIILAGPTAPLPAERIMSIKPTKFTTEPLQLQCEWMECRFKTTVMQVYMEHVACHVPAVEVHMHDAQDIQVFLYCRWQDCPWKTDKKAEDLQRHLYLHAYHTKLKCIGVNTRSRSAVKSCKADPGNRNILPDLAENLVCAWDKCSQTFINIQSYYDHIKAHCDNNAKGKNVEGGIRCRWAGCSGSFANIVKLKDHMRSHTQEKLLACPTCGRTVF
ncbi:Histone H4 transcription factor [Orchesella cincta]|uniref:Histone H4 transcription factor n=1 Tax=Orchesella cincta TaxID=48709 RepID=A0A1D2NFR6_ORCCI|nr:Histone H4 transcription factor [Orchesella cincta]